MKEIKAFLRPNKVNEILTHLKKEGFENITISVAEGTGNLQNEDASVSLEFAVTDSKIAKLEMVVKDSDVEVVVRVISEYGRTIYPGDGIIYVSEVRDVFRVKTGDRVEI